MRPLYLLGALSLTALGCDATRVLSDFGDPYQLLSQDDQAAVLDGTRLLVPVQYGGGCAEHTFALRSDLDADSATVWLHHDANGDACEAFITETVSAELPAPVAAAARVTLRAPAGLGSDAETTVALR